MTKDERISKMLDHYKDGRARFFYDSCTEVFNEDGPAFIGAHQLFFKEMIELDLLEKQQDLVAVLTTNGNNIIEEFGSWLKYKESQTTRHKRLVEAESKKGKVETVRWWGDNWRLTSWRVSWRPIDKPFSKQ
ncbi:MAG: hypothetical protein WDN75_16020 [Bacteroidota bacterium]